MKQRLTLFGLLMGTSLLAHPTQDFFRPFTTDSISVIKQYYQGQPFMISLWSLDCPPCHKELQLLGKWKKKNPSINLVVILTDYSDDYHEARDRLIEYQLEGVEHWVFADAFVERLRYSIDPKVHQANGRSGLVTEVELQTWLDATTAAMLKNNSLPAAK